MKTGQKHRAEKCRSLSWNNHFLCARNRLSIKLGQMRISQMLHREYSIFDHFMLLKSALTFEDKSSESWENTHWTTKTSWFELIAKCVNYRIRMVLKRSQQPGLCWIMKWQMKCFRWVASQYIQKLGCTETQ